VLHAYDAADQNISRRLCIFSLKVKTAFISSLCLAISTIKDDGLKVLTNEKRGGLKVIAFDGSPLKLFALRFSNKSVQAPSSERPKTTQRTLFLSFEINNCLQITA
jgi:hypothetical protein